MSTSWRTCTPETVGEMTGTVVVIDVLRAFSTACVVFEYAPASYELTGSVETALARKDEGAIVIGEVNGAKVEGFHYGNSPAEPGLATTTGQAVVHRSSNGTTAVEAAVKAKTIYCASFLNASATYAAIKDEEDVVFCITGIGFRGLGGPGDGDEDLACAQYIMALGDDRTTDPIPYTDRIHTSNAGRDEHTNPLHDRAICAQVDRFAKALKVEHKDGRIWLTPIGAG